MAYDWPGNIRELENVIERAVVLADGPAVTLDDLPPELRQPGRRRLRPRLIAAMASSTAASNPPAPGAAGHKASDASHPAPSGVSHPSPAAAASVWTSADVEPHPGKIGTPNSSPTNASGSSTP